MLWGAPKDVAALFHRRIGSLEEFEMAWMMSSRPVLAKQSVRMLTRLIITRFTPIRFERRAEGTSVREYAVRHGGRFLGGCMKSIQKDEKEQYIMQDITQLIRLVLISKVEMRSREKAWYGRD